MKDEYHMMTSAEWIAFFEKNRRNLMPINWNTDYRLTPQEREAILKSLQQFQLGESSEGRRFIQLADTYSQQSGDFDYVSAVKHFIKEEQRHASDLGRFMEQQNLPCLQQHPVDGIFRFLRRAINLEVAVVVLLTAEIIAVTYYKALHDATQSPTLRTICRQILRDEIQHLNFQSETLIKLRGQRSTIGLWMTHQFQRLLFANTLLVVWIGHRSVYRAGGFSFRAFVSSNWSRFERVFSKTVNRVNYLDHAEDIVLTTD